MEAPAILETHQLTKSFQGFVAVQSVDLRVRKGSIHALIGPNGAGKTTLFNLLTRFLRATSGRIVYKGEDITGVPASAVTRRGIVRSFQISAVYPHLTVLENVRVALQRKHTNCYNFWRSERHLEVLHDRARELLESVGLGGFETVLAAELPYGRKRALEIATTLAADPEMMLLDEPTAGMTSADVSKVTALVRRVAEGRTVLLVEHNLRVVSDLCDRITVMQRGQILAEGTYAEVSTNPEVRQAYMGQGHHHG